MVHGIWAVLWEDAINGTIEEWEEEMEMKRERARRDGRKGKRTVVLGLLSVVVSVKKEEEGERGCI